VPAAGIGEGGSTHPIKPRSIVMRTPQSHTARENPPSQSTLEDLRMPVAAAERLDPVREGPRKAIMKLRSFLCALTAGLSMFALVSPTADAAIGPKHLQKLAQRQTQLLLQNFSDGDLASPSTCNEGQSRKGTKGVFLLPTRYDYGGDSGDVTFNCKVSTRAVLLDLGGAAATEDANPGSLWTLTTTQEKLRFTPGNLERICDDVLNVFYLTPAAATVDGQPISGTRISTPEFVATVRPSATTLFGDSQDVGHPGKLATSFCGWKTTLRLKPGRHVIVVHLTDTTQNTITYNIFVQNSHRHHGHH